MINLRGSRVVLRAVELGDVDVMYGIENDLHNWSVSGTNVPFSKYILEKFIESQRVDICASNQLRLMVENFDGDVVGIVDLYDIDSYNHRAGVGIFILAPYRGVGYGADVLSTVHRYCRDALQIHQLWCDVNTDNLASIKLFESLGYQMVGVKRDWQFKEGKYYDVILYQLVLEE